MVTVVRQRARLSLIAAFGAAAVLAVVVARPAGSVIPASQTVGKVTYVDLSGTTDISFSIRAFSLENDADGGLSGRATFGLPRVIQDVGTKSPLIMDALARGKHLPTITVALYRPSSTTKSQQWTFYDTLFRVDAQTQSGPASAYPWQTVSWEFRKIRQVTYEADGTTVSTNICFDVAQNVAC